MSFGAGMGAGMGAGIGIGIGIGVSSGQKKAVEQIQEYLLNRGLTIRDNMGKEIDMESVLEEATCQKQQGAGNGAWIAVLAIGILALLAGGGVMAYLLLN